MKNIALFAGILLISISTFAQKGKFGHIDSQALLESMPERQQVVEEITKYGAELEDALTTMTKEFETKYTEYVAEADSMSQFMRKTKEEELQMMNQRIEKFRVQAQQDLQNKEIELVEPLFTKAREAIKETAKELALVYVFDVAEGGGGAFLLYYSEESIDLLPKVKVKLGITN